MLLPLSPEPEYVTPIVVYFCTNEVGDINGQLIYTSGEDICIYARLLQILDSAQTFIRKMDKGTVDELAKVVRPLLRRQPLPSVKFNRLPTLMLP